MSHRISLFLILLAAIVPLTAAPPNVVILFTDDQGTLDANCYGSDDLITPNIDKLAATGVRFTQAYAHTVCCPARAALMTGRHPQRGGVTDWMQGSMNGPQGRNMALTEVTLAEALREAGYRTALFGKWHLGAHKDHGAEKQGFDEFFGIRNGFIDNYRHYFLHGSRLSRPLRGHQGGQG
jgi:arylsulfatase A